VHTDKLLTTVTRNKQCNHIKPEKKTATTVGSLAAIWLTYYNLLLSPLQPLGHRTDKPKTLKKIKFDQNKQVT